MRVNLEILTSKRNIASEKSAINGPKPSFFLSLALAT